MPASGSGEGAVHIELSAIAQYVVAGARELVRDRLGRKHAIGLGALALIVALDLRVVAHGEVRRLDIGPGQILVAVLGVAFALALAGPVSSRIVSPRIRPMPLTLSNDR